LFNSILVLLNTQGEDHGDHSKDEEDGPGAIAIESLLNIRTVASLSLESNRLDDYEKALTNGNEDIVKSSFKKGSLVAIGKWSDRKSFSLDIRLISLM